METRSQSAKPLSSRVFRVAAGAVVASALALTGCSSPSAEQSGSASGGSTENGTGGTPTVVVSSYPLAFLAQAVGGDQVEVEDVAAAAGHTHHLELSPAQVKRVSDADLALFLSGGFQPAMEDAVRVSEVNSFDGMTVVSEEDLLPGDSHIWLNPLISADLADQIAVELAEVNPEKADYYKANAATVRTALEESDAEYQKVLADCSGEVLLTSHQAFGYMAARYGLEQVGVLGIDPEAEPSPARIAEVQKLVQERGITTLFVEPGGHSHSDHEHDDEHEHEEEHDHEDHEHEEEHDHGDDDEHSHSHDAEAHSDNLTETLGVQGLHLDPLEIQADATKDFLAVLHSNLHALADGLGCAVHVH